MATDITKMRSTRYVVDIFTIIINNTPISIESNFINGITIEKDYDNDLFPVLGVSFSCNDELYYNIIENKTNVKFKLRMMKYEYDHTDKIRAKKVLINDIFISFIEDENLNIGKDLKKEIKDDMSYTANKNMRVFLFKEKDLKSSKKYFNMVVENTTMTNLIAYCMSEAGINKVLMSPMNNVTTYDEVIIPPMMLSNTFTYLENIYDGFYKLGSIIFMDYDRMYFIDKSHLNLVFSANEPKENIFNVLEPSSALSASSGMFFDAETSKNYINIPVGNISKGANGMINEHVIGNNAMVISSDTVTMIEPNIDEVTGSVYKLLLDRYNNKNIVSTYKSSYEENNMIIKVIVEGVDIASLTPNKSYTLLFENQALHRKNGGKYRLSSVVCNIKKNGATFIPHSMITLKRMR